MPERPPRRRRRRTITSPDPPAPPIPLTVAPEGVSFAVRVVPRAGRTAIAGVRDGALLVRLAAAPVDGAANTALVSCLAAALRWPPRQILLVAGHSGRRKVVRVLGLDAPQLAARLAAILGG